MNRISLISIMIFHFLVFFRASGQSLTNYHRRTINETALQLIKDYEIYSRFTSDNRSINESYLISFENLFSKDASLYLDIIPSNRVSDEVNIDDYKKMVKLYYSNGIGVKIKDILFDAPIRKDDNGYTMTAELTKIISGFTTTKASYRDTIPLVFTFGFNISENKLSDMKILKITGEERGRFLKLRVQKFITKQPVYNAEIKFDSKTVYTDKLGMAIINDIDPGQKHKLIIAHDPYKEISYSNLNIDDFISGNSIRKHKKLRLDYYDPNEFIFIMNTLNFIISPIASFGIPGIKTIISEEQNDDLDIVNLKERGGFSPRLGLHVGLYLIKSEKFDFSIKSGVEKNFVRSSALFDSCEIAIESPLPQLDRTVRLKDFKQTVNLNFTDLPIIISFYYKFFNNLDLGADFGIRFSNLNRSTYSTKTDLTVFTEYENTKKKINTGPDDFEAQNRFLSYQAGLSIRKKIAPSLKVYAGPRIILLNRELTKNDPPSGLLTYDEKINNILDTYTSSRINYWAMEFGLIIDFNSIKLRKKL